MTEKNHETVSLADQQSIKHTGEGHAKVDATAAFLDLLEEDMAARPQAMLGISASMIEKLQSLTHGIEVDLDAPLEGDVNL